MADPAQGSCRFASHRERSSTPCADFRRAPRSPPLLLPRRFLFRAEIFLERRHSGTEAQKVEAVKFFSGRTPAAVDHPVSSPVRHLVLSFHVDVYRPRLTPVRACFIFIHRRVLISPPPPRQTRSAYEHRMGDKWSLRGGGGRRKKSDEMTSNNNGGAEERENINCFVPSAATRRRGWSGTGMGGRGWEGSFW